MRIVYFGLPLGALLLHSDGHRIELACVAPAQGVGLRRLRRLLGERVRWKPNAHDPALWAEVRAARPELLVSWFWTSRLPVALVDEARLGGIGVHPSLLPRHRGPDPTRAAIAAGDAATGVTAHRIAAEYDTGEIVAQRSLAIDPDWDAWQLARALDRPGLALLRETVRAIEERGRVDSEPQEEALATAAPLPTDEECELRLDRPTTEVLRQVRSLAPAPGAFTELGGRTLVVVRARPAPVPLHAGEVAAMEGRTYAGTADGAIEILGAELDGAPVLARDLAEFVSAAAADDGA